MKLDMIPGVLVLLVLLFAPVRAQAQVTLNCDLPQQPSDTIRTGQPFTTQACIPAIVTTPDGDVPVRIDGWKMQIDAQAPLQVGKLVLGAASPTLKLSAVSWRSPAGVQKGQHTVTMIPWSYPLMADNVTPDPTKPPQEAAPLVIPFVASDPAAQTGPPPSAQKGRVIR